MTNNSKLRLIGYVRVSTDNQKEEGTIELQINALEEYCLKNNYELVSIFKDDGVSGSKELENRPGLVELFNYLEIESPNIDGVLIYKLDRLARDLYIQEYIIKQIKRLNTNLVSIKEGADLSNNDPMRTAFRQFMGIVSELEKAFITMRLSEGRNNKARKGGYAGGSCAIGYKTTDKELTVDIQTADIVRRIFDLNSQHLSLRAIAKELQDDGIKTTRGGRWQAETIRYILNNKKYKGLICYKAIEAERNDLNLILN
jgi:site-specific DNA recombinase